MTRALWIALAACALPAAARAGADAPAAVPYALADFNAGRGNVLKWTTGAAATKSAVFMDQIGFPSTRAYVKAVQRRRFLYALLMRFGS